MCFFKKKKVAEKVKEDSQLVETNYKSVDALIVLAKNNESLINELKTLQNTLKYLIATENQKVVSFDKKIKDYIGDLRIVLTKSGGDNVNKVEDIITDIKLAITDRNTRMKD